MDKRHLITTPLKDSWSEDLPMLFISESSKTYALNKNFKNLETGNISGLKIIDVETVSYHWDDREQYYRDSTYLEDLYERILVNLANELNNIHGVNHNLRYWRILAGPWLYQFVEILFALSENSHCI